MVNILKLCSITVFFTILLWPKIKAASKKGKRIYFILTFISLALAIMLIINRNIPGPTELLEGIFGFLSH